MAGNAYAFSKIEACVCTRDRPNDLATCLGSIMASDRKIDRVIVSDDSTNVETRAMVAARFPTVVYVEGPRSGLGANRNRALENVIGDYVFFLDDDAVLDPGFVTKALEFAAFRNLDMAETILTGFEINNGREIRSNDQSFLGFQSRPYAVGGELNTIVINSAVIPASWAKELGFDEFLIYGYEEVDFALRARRAGVRIILCPALRNLHFPSDVNRDYYAPLIDASRIYVTFKRYCSFERNYPKAVLFVIVASGHLLAARVKRFGLRGIWRGVASLGRAYGFIFHFLADTKHGYIRPRA